MTNQPSDLALDERTALIVVDVQNDFADPDGSLYVDGGEDVIGVINPLVDATVAAGGAVVYTQDWHPARTPHFRTDGGTWPPHCIAETWGAELHPDLTVAGRTVRKGTGNEDGYSGFTARDVNTGTDVPTGLVDVLGDHGVDRVVVVGLARDVCVRETALDARRLGYDTTVVLDATRSVDPDDQDAIDTMREAGARIV